LAKHFNCSKANISKILKRLFPPPPEPMPESFQGLTAREQAFVLAKASGKSATQAALETCEVKSREVAKAVGYDLAHKPDVEKAIEDVLQDVGLTKKYRVLKLKSHVDNRSADVSLKALDQSWKLDGSYAAEKHLIGVVTYADMCKDYGEVEETIRQLKKELGFEEMSKQEQQEFIASGGSSWTRQAEEEEVSPPTGDVSK